MSKKACTHVALLLNLQGRTMQGAGGWAVAHPRFFFFTFSSYLFILIHRLYCIWHPKKNKLFIVYIFKLNFF